MLASVLEPAAGTGALRERRSPTGAHDAALSQMRSMRFGVVAPAMPEWVMRFSNRRRFEPIGAIPPAKAEVNVHAPLKLHTGRRNQP